MALPVEVDVAPSYQQQTTCDPTAKPGAVAFGQLLNAHYGTRVTHISRNCNNGVTEHSEGRALDWMISAYDAQQRAIADSIVQWLSADDANGNPGAMARRFGINYIIWNRKMWRAYAPERGWATYTGSHPHDDHIHISFTWDGAYKRTSWWTGVALRTVTVDGGATGAPAPHTVPILTSTGYHVLRRGSLGEEVRLLQQALKIGVDGSFGPGTEQAVRAFQTQHKLTVDGAVGSQSWTKLIELGLVPARSASAPAPAAPPAAAHPLEQYSTLTLRRGSTGAAVAALQRALSLTADGSFGPGTEQGVRAFQQSKSLTSDGVVIPNVWNALMGRSYFKTGESAPAAPPAAAHPLEQYSTLTLRRGSTGAAVAALQRALSLTA
ncbi:MAG TPA: peptidoglycan-binding protein, partial [Intrasporangiaceae bacterium]|nr:peptidoglycan-binding protein [Intrasporangiaceae bacterium]